METEKQLKNSLLMDLFFRMLEVSGKSYKRNYTVNERFDPISAKKQKAYVFMERGFKSPMGPFQQRDYPIENLPQVLKIEVTSIWGIEIEVTDFITGETVMDCHYSPKKQWNRKKKQDEQKYFITRKTPNKPQDTLRNILWNAEFLDYEEAKRYKEVWDDEESFMLLRGWDPFGSPSDYE